MEQHEQHEGGKEQPVRAAPQGGNGQAGRPTSLEAIQRELDETRTEMSATLAAIASKMSPEALTDRAMEYFRLGGGEFGRNMGEALRRNPLPAALTGIGIAWMMWADRTGHAGSTGGGPGMMEKVSSAGESAKSGYAHARESASEAYGRAEERLSRGSRAAGEMAQRAGRTGADWSASAQRWFDEQPLAVGAIGIALGALLGSALPRSREEAETVGPLAEHARQSASQTAEELKRKAGEVVSDTAAKTAEAASERARAAEEEATSRKQETKAQVSRKGSPGPH